MEQLAPGAVCTVICPVPPRDTGERTLVKVTPAGAVVGVVRVRALVVGGVGDAVGGAGVTVRTLGAAGVMSVVRSVAVRAVAVAVAVRAAPVIAAVAGTALPPHAVPSTRRTTPNRTGEA
jgi:hypothetical protein